MNSEPSPPVKNPNTRIKKENAKEKKASPLSDPNSKPKRAELSANIANQDDSSQKEKECNKVGHTGAVHGPPKKKFKVQRLNKKIQENTEQIGKGTVQEKKSPHVEEFKDGVNSVDSVKPLAAPPSFLLTNQAENCQIEASAFYPEFKTLIQHQNQKPSLEVSLSYLDAGGFKIYQYFQELASLEQHKQIEQATPLIGQFILRHTLRDILQLSTLSYEIETRELIPSPSKYRSLTFPVIANLVCCWSQNLRKRGKLLLEVVSEVLVGRVFFLKIGERLPEVGKEKIRDSFLDEVLKGQENEIIEITVEADDRLILIRLIDAQRLLQSEEKAEMAQAILKREDEEPVFFKVTVLDSDVLDGLKREEYRELSSLLWMRRACDLQLKWDDCNKQ